MINNRYNIFHQVGEGRSKVFLCHDVDYPSIPLVFKVIPNSSSKIDKELFKKEYFLLRKFNHPNIVRVDKFGSVYLSSDKEIKTGSLFITQEYYDGEKLYEHSFKNKEELLKKVIVQLLDVLTYLHRSNYLYYDLKGENVLIKIKDGIPEIRLIDFGLTSHFNDEQNEKKGTADYMAPELFKKQKPDYKIDYYSLGVLLYKIVYGDYPYKGDNELDTYRAHLHNKIIYRDTGFSKNIIDVIKRLLKQNPEERYSNPLQILSDLNLQPGKHFLSDAGFIPTFVGRNKIIEVINQKNEDEENEVIIISGSEGSGKSSLLENISVRYENFVLLDNKKNKSNLKKMLIEEIYSALSKNNSDNYTLLNEFNSLLSEIGLQDSDKIKSFISRVTNQNKFIFLIDDFDKLINSEVELLKSIIPILLVNGSKVVISSDSSFTNYENFFSFCCKYTLKQFNINELDDLIEQNVCTLYPIDQIKEIIIHYTDLLPSNIFYLMNDLLSLKIIKHKKEGFTLNLTNSEREKIKKSTNNRLEFVYKKLSVDEKILCEFLSLFIMPINSEAIESLSENHQYKEIIKSLIEKNIFAYNSFKDEVSFNSNSFQKYVYLKIQVVREKHRELVDLLEKKNISLSLEELAYQYECAELFDKSYSIYINFIESKEKQYDFNYCKDILTHLLAFPLSNELRLTASMKLIKVLMNIGDYKYALEIIKNLYSSEMKINEKDDLLIMEGNCLIHLGELNEGKSKLNSIISRVNDKELYQKLLLDIASAEFDLNLYDEVRSKCLQIINSQILKSEVKAKAFTLIGLSDFFEKEDTVSAINLFNKAKVIYESADHQLKTAQLEMNIGNIYNVKGDFEKAEYYWESSLLKNKNLGSIEQEANLHNNLGINRFERGLYDETLEHYKRAEIIYKSLGNLRGLGLVLANLGEVYLSLGDYTLSINSLDKSIKIFNKIEDKVEVFESLFLLGYTYLKLNAKQKTAAIVNDMKKLIVSGSTSDKQNTHIEYLTLLMNFDIYDTNTYKNIVIELRDKYFNYGIKYHYFRLHFLLISHLIETEKYIEAIDQLNNKVFQEMITKNILAEAEYYYYVGKISFSTTGLVEKSGITYYQTAFEKIKNESTTEITFTILFSLAECYVERGLVNKAKSYINYARAVLQYFTDNIEYEDLKKMYSEQKERSEIVKLLIDWEKYYL